MRYLPRLVKLLLVAALIPGVAAVAQQSAGTITSQTYSGGILHLTFAGVSGGTYTIDVPVAAGEPLIGPAALTYTPVVPPPPPPPDGPTIPANATKVVLDPLTWKQTKDAGTPGTACTPTLPCTDPYPVEVDAAHPTAHEYSMSYSGRAGVRWSADIAKDPDSLNFVYDTWVYASDVSQVANLEMDINQVTAAGNTRILGFQCSHYDHAWDYTLSKLPTGGSWHWVPSKVACDPTLWATKDANGSPLWHHIQIVGHFDANDVSYYDEVWLDGVKSVIGASGSTRYALGWSKGSVVVNFQIDGLNPGTGSASVDASQLTIYRW